MTREEYILSRRGGASVGGALGSSRKAQVSSDIKKLVAQPVRGDTSKLPLFAQFGGGVMKKTADIAMGISGLGEKVLQKTVSAVSPRAAEFLGLEEGRTVAERLVPRELTKPETTGETVGGLAVDLAIMFSSTPLKGLNMPTWIKQASPVLNALDDFVRVGTKGAAEYGLKSGLLDRFSEESVKRGAVGGALGEMAAMGLTKAVALKKAKGIAKIEKTAREMVGKPIKKAPGYVPQPSDKMADFQLLKKDAAKGLTAHLQ